MTRGRPPGPEAQGDEDDRGSEVPGHAGGAGRSARERWTVVRDRTWVTGELDPDSGKSRRAREAGVVTAWRSFEQATTGRSAWVEVVPYATAGDAALSLRQSPRYFVGTDHPDEVVVAGGEVGDRRLPGAYGSPV